MLLYVLVVNILFVFFFIAWYGQPEKQEVLWTYLGVWVVTMTILMPFIFWRPDWLPWSGVFPRNVNLGLAGILGLSGAFTMVLISIALTRAFGGMALVQLPMVMDQVVAILRLFLPKVNLKPTFLTVTSGFEAVAFQGVVSGVEEAMKLSLTLGLALVLFAVVHHHLNSGGRTGKVSKTQKLLILSASVLLTGTLWDLLHGLQSYTHVTEFVSAFAGNLIMAGTTFLTGNPFPAFFMHWLYNIIAPAISTALVASLLVSPTPSPVLFVGLCVVGIVIMVLVLWLAKGRQHTVSLKKEQKRYFA